MLILGTLGASTGLGLLALGIAAVVHALGNRPVPAPPVSRRARLRRQRRSFGQARRPR